MLIVLLVKLGWRIWESFVVIYGSKVGQYFFKLDLRIWVYVFGLVCVELCC